MRQLSAERIHHYDERKSNYHRKQRGRCGTGRHSRGGEGLREEGCHPEEGCAQGTERRQGQSQGLAEEEAKAGKKAKAVHATEASTPRAESKGRKDPGTDRAAQRGEPD